jgi:hypothetical protein
MTVAEQPVVPHVMDSMSPDAALDALREERDAVRLRLRDAKHVERAAQTALRRTRITDDPRTVLLARQRYTAAREVVEVTAIELAAIQLRLHDLALTTLTRHRLRQVSPDSRSASTRAANRMEESRDGI